MTIELPCVHIINFGLALSPTTVVSTKASRTLNSVIKDQEERLIKCPVALNVAWSYSPEQFSINIEFQSAGLPRKPTQENME